MKRMCLSLFLAAPLALASPELASPLHVDAEHSTGVMTALTLDLAGYRSLKQMSAVSMTDFQLGDGVSVDLNLMRREAYTPDARLVAMTDHGEVGLARPDVTMFGGYVAGDPDSTVFLAFSPYGVEGFVEAMDQTWIVSSGTLTQDLPIGVYNLTTLPAGVINWSQWECAADQLKENMRPIEPQGGGVSRGTNCFELEYAIETDQEYLGLFGGDQTAANTYMATLIGAVSEIYQRDLFTTVHIAWSRLWTTTDPWTQGDSVNQLYQFRDYWNANMNSVTRDLGHFLSGRALGGGVAWLPGICSDYNFGLSGNLSGFFPYPIQDNNSQNWDLMVVAHEGGHNIGAPHTHEQSPPIDNCAGGNCSVTPHGTIMSYCHLCPGGMTNVEMHFHPQTINQYILPTLNSSSCGLEGTCDRVTFSFPGGLPSLVSPNGTTTLEMNVMGEGSVTPASGTGTLHYDAGNGEQAIAMTEGPADHYVVNMPATECGRTVDYWFTVQGSDGETYSSPATGVHSSTSAEAQIAGFSDDFESDAGWTTASDANAGDWERGVPAGDGQRGDPPSDYDGSGQCYLTGNAAGNSDVDDGSVTLTSPILDATGTAARIEYARWYNNTAGALPGVNVFVVEVSNDGGAHWSTLETVGPTGGEVSGGWFYKSFPIADVFASPSDQFRVRFTASDLAGGSVIEAAVDAVSIVSFECGGCEADRNGDGQLDFFDVQGFLNDFSVEDESTDLTGDGSWDFFDVQAYLGLFAAGCP